MLGTIGTIRAVPCLREETVMMLLAFSFVIKLAWCCIRMIFALVVTFDEGEHIIVFICNQTRTGNEIS